MVRLKILIPFLLLVTFGFLVSLNTTEIGMAQNLTQNLTKANSNVSNATTNNNPFLSGRTPFGSAALPP
jgi:hypothetical protein